EREARCAEFSAGNSDETVEVSFPQRPDRLYVAGLELSEPEGDRPLLVVGHDTIPGGVQGQGARTGWRIINHHATRGSQILESPLSEPDPQGIPSSHGNILRIFCAWRAHFEVVQLSALALLRILSRRLSGVLRSPG